MLVKPIGEAVQKGAGCVRKEAVKFQSMLDHQTVLQKCFDENGEHDDLF